MSVRPCTCDNVRIGQPFVRDRDCGRCWHWHHTPALRAAWGGDDLVFAVELNKPIKAKRIKSAKKIKPIALPCIHEGAILEFCTSCGNKEGRHVRDCDLYERCTRGVVSSKVRACVNCSDYDDGTKGTSFAIQGDVMSEQKFQVDPKREVKAVFFDWKEAKYPGFGQPGQACGLYPLTLMFACPGCGKWGSISCKEGEKQKEYWKIESGTLEDVTTLTLSPSIHCIGCCDWHGYLVIGNFQMKPKS